MSIRKELEIKKVKNLKQEHFGQIFRQVFFSPETNPYLQKFLKQIKWKPQNLGVFAGKISYPDYGFVDKQMIRFIMWMTKGPTDPTTVTEFTDWSKVEEFGQMVAGL